MDIPASKKLSDSAGAKDIDGQSSSSQPPPVPKEEYSTILVSAKHAHSRELFPVHLMFSPTNEALASPSLASKLGIQPAFDDGLDAVFDITIVGALKQELTFSFAEAPDETILEHIPPILFPGFDVMDQKGLWVLINQAQYDMIRNIGADGQPPQLEYSLCAYDIPMGYEEKLFVY